MTMDPSMGTLCPEPSSSFGSRGTVSASEAPPHISGFVTGSRTLSSGERGFRSDVGGVPDGQWVRRCQQLRRAEGSPATHPVISPCLRMALSEHWGAGQDGHGAVRGHRCPHLPANPFVVILSLDRNKTLSVVSVISLFTI